MMKLLFLLAFVSATKFDLIAAIFGDGLAGAPLFLTPLINAGQLSKAKSMSRVGYLGLVENLPSYSGYLTVNADWGSNLFFWFFPAKVQPEKAPVLLWLNGGPGSSSMFGLLVENGPYYVNKYGQPQLRSVTWAEPYSMLYVDSPVGTGFSFTGDKRGFARNETDVARDLFEALQQFFTLFPEYVGNDFYATGESYAGKYVPAIAYAIHTAVNPRVRINLKGLAIGNALIDTVSMLNYADLYYQLGLIDANQADYMRQQTDMIISLINQGRYSEALNVSDPLTGGFFSKTTYFQNVSGFNFLNNLLYTEEPESTTYYIPFLQTTVVRRAIHVGNQPFSDYNMTVGYYLLEDTMKSVKDWLEVLVEKYKVLLYSGQLDLNVPYSLTVNFLSTFNWSGASAFADVSRQIWRIKEGGDVAGYARSVKTFTEVLVRNAGHYVPTDQAEAALDMVSRFVDGRPFTP